MVCQGRYMGVLAERLMEVTKGKVSEEHKDSGRERVLESDICNENRRGVILCKGKKLHAAFMDLSTAFYREVSACQGGGGTL